MEFVNTSILNEAIYDLAIFKGICHAINGYHKDDDGEVPETIKFIYGSDISDEVKSEMKNLNRTLFDECDYIFTKNPDGTLRAKRLNMHPKTAENYSKAASRAARAGY